MSDYASSLPVRTENNGDVVSKIADGTTPSQLLTVNADGSINITDNSGSITIDATNLDIRDLVFATDKVDASGSTVALDAPTLAALESITVQNGAGAAAVNIQDGGNSITVDAVDLDIRDLAFATDKVDASGSVVALDAPTLAALESITVQNGAGASAVNIQDGGNSITVDAVDLDIRDLTAASDSVKSQIADGSGTYYSATNPVPVSISNNNIGDEVNDYNTVAAVAAAATSNHDYTVTALKTLLLSQIEASGSGKMKIEVQIETAAASGVFNTRFVQFNSTAETNMHIELKAPISVVAGARVRIIRTNRDNQAQDVYSTICGQEV
jgi:hypothetical protein